MYLLSTWNTLYEIDHVTRRGNYICSMRYLTSINEWRATTHPMHHLGRTIKPGEVLKLDCTMDQFLEYETLRIWHQSVESSLYKHYRDLIETPEREYNRMSNEHKITYENRVREILENVPAHN